MKVMQLLADIHYKIYDENETDFFPSGTDFESHEMHMTANWPFVDGSEDWCGEFDREMPLRPDEVANA